MSHACWHGASGRKPTANLMKSKLTSVDPHPLNYAQINAKQYAWFPAESNLPKRESRPCQPGQSFGGYRAGLVPADRITLLRSRSVIRGHASTKANNSGNRNSEATTFPLSSGAVCSATAARESVPVRNVSVSPAFSRGSCRGSCSLSAHYSLMAQ
jgi:hypothetical protein